MADNVSVTPGAGAKVLTDEVSYSGETVHLQGASLFTVTGAEGVRTAARYTPPPATVVSVLNSTTTLLEGNQEYVGTWESSLGYESISSIAYADQAGADNGLKIEYSHDGVTAIDSEAMTIVAGQGNRLVSGVLGAFYRMRYLNGANGQGTFILHTILHTVFSIVPPVIGPRPMAQSQPMTMATDQDPIDVNQFLYSQDSVTVYGRLYNTVTVTLTAIGSTQLVAAPSAGFHLVVKYFAYSLLDTAPVTVALRAGTGGANQYTRRLQTQGQTWDHPLEFTEWHLASATGLFGNLSAALSAGGVSVDVEYETRLDS